MKYGICTLDDVDVYGKTVICRVDINQPVERTTGTLKSISRIQACIPTLKELTDRGAKVVVLAHQGSDIEYQNYYTTAPHARVLSELLKREIRFIPDVCGPTAQEAIKSLNPGEIVLLDNVRFMAEEQTLFELNLKLTHELQANTLLVTQLAPLADLYVCDAFAAAHRDQPSLCGFQQVLPSVMGRLFEKEYCVVSHLMESPEHPCVFVLGGAKVSDAFLMMRSVLENNVADRILTGGLVGNILLAAIGEEIGDGSREFIEKSGYSYFIETGRKLVAQYGDRIVLPTDGAYIKDGNRIEAFIGNVPKDAALVDIGTNTASVYKNIIRQAKTVFVNGPMGVFEKSESERGTEEVWNALGDTNAFTVVGGGDSITATAKYNKTEKINYICTGGGALIRFLTGKELPVVKALRFAADKWNTLKKE